MSEQEIWRDIEINPSFQVSNLGRVRYKNTKRIRPSWTSDKGYKRVNMHRRRFTVHRLVAMAFLEPDASRVFVNHKDSDRTNNHVDNLEWVTARENSIHAKRAGRLVPSLGSKNGNSVLTEADVVEIKSRFIGGGESKAGLAREFGCSWQAIALITSGVTWKHINPIV